MDVPVPQETNELIDENLVAALSACTALKMIPRGTWLVPQRLCIGVHPAMTMDMNQLLKDSGVNLVLSVSEQDSHSQANEVKYLERCKVALVRYPIVTRLTLPVERVFVITRLVAAMLTEVPSSCILLCDGSGSGACTIIAAAVLAMHYKCTFEQAAHYLALRYNATHPHATNTVRRLPASDLHYSGAKEVHHRLLQPRIETLFNRSTNPCRELMQFALTKAWLVDGSPKSKLSSSTTRSPPYTGQKRTYANLVAGDTKPKYNNNNKPTHTGAAAKKRTTASSSSQINRFKKKEVLPDAPPY